MCFRIFGYASVLLSASAFAHGSEHGALVPSVTVVGSGEVAAKPDVAEIRAGVVVQAKSASEALKANNAAMDKIFKSLASQGIAEKDIQTSTFQINPEYEKNPESERTREIVGYRVTNEVRVKVRELKILGTVLDESVNAGANQVHGISFSVADPEQVLDEARRKAMADARRKAELYTQAADVRLGRAMLIQERSPQIPQPRTIRFAARAESMSAVPVASGEQEFRVTVTVTYSID